MAKRGRPYSAENAYRNYVYETKKLYNKLETYGMSKTREEYMTKEDFDIYMNYNREYGYKTTTKKLVNEAAKNTVYGEFDTGIAKRRKGQTMNRLYLQRRARNIINHPEAFPEYVGYSATQIYLMLLSYQITTEEYVSRMSQYQELLDPRGMSIYGSTDNESTEQALNEALGTK